MKVEKKFIMKTVDLKQAISLYLSKISDQPVFPNEIAFEFYNGDVKETYYFDSVHIIQHYEHADNNKLF